MTPTLDTVAPPGVSRGVLWPRYSNSESDVSDCSRFTTELIALCALMVLYALEAKVEWLWGLKLLRVAEEEENEEEEEDDEIMYSF